jgi:hypothetical protein
MNPDNQEAQTDIVERKPQKPIGSPERDTEQVDLLPPTPDIDQDPKPENGVDHPKPEDQLKPQISPERRPSKRASQHYLEDEDEIKSLTSNMSNIDKDKDVVESKTGPLRTFFNMMRGFIGVGFLTIPYLIENIGWYGLLIGYPITCFAVIFLVFKGNRLYMEYGCRTSLQMTWSIKEARMSNL